jgi:hypothetical protein
LKNFCQVRVSDDLAFDLGTGACAHKRARGRLLGVVLINAQIVFEHCTRPEFQVRFRWRPHSVTFWDNRSVQHMALWDYYPQVRSGRRVTIKGDRPF